MAFGQGAEDGPDTTVVLGSVISPRLSAKGYQLPTRKSRMGMMRSAGTGSLAKKLEMIACHLEGRPVSRSRSQL